MSPFYHMKLCKSVQTIKLRPIFWCLVFRSLIKYLGPFIFWTEFERFDDTGWSQDYRMVNIFQIDLRGQKLWVFETFTLIFEENSLLLFRSFFRFFCIMTKFITSNQKPPLYTKHRVAGRPLNISSNVQPWSLE